MSNNLIPKQRQTTICTLHNVIPCQPIFRTNNAKLWTTNNFYRTNNSFFTPNASFSTQFFLESATNQYQPHTYTFSSQLISGQFQTLSPYYNMGQTPTPPNPFTNQTHHITKRSRGEKHRGRRRGFS
jgi:hypothetical protein